MKALQRLAALALAACLGGGALAQAPIAERVKQCAPCHGEDGNSRIENIPSLAGQPEFFVLNQLFLMREGVRRVEAMAALTKGLKDGEIDALAKHFASLPPVPSGEPIDAALVERGAKLSVSLRCASCHLPTMAGQQQMPRLAKQRVDYMINAMKALRDNQRQGADTAMTAVIVGVSNADLTALAHFVASR